jgi:hypothetical protein
MDLNHIIETFLTGIAGVITALQGPAVVEYVKAKFSKSEEDEEKDPIKRELEYSCVINEELEAIRLDMKADRCWILMYHNGGHFLHSKRSMQKFSVMFETSAPGVSGIGMVFNNIPVSLFSRSVDELVKNGKICIKDYKDPKIATFGLKEAAEATGARSSYSYALFDIVTDECIGTMGIDYLKKKNLDAHSIEELGNKAQRISGFLSKFIKE